MAENGNGSGNGQAMKTILGVAVGLIIGLSAQWVAYVKDAVSTQDAQAMVDKALKSERELQDARFAGINMQLRSIQDTLGEIKNEVKGR